MLYKSALINNKQVMLYEKELWWQKQNLMYTATGYGQKIPTTWVIRYKNKVRRVYCTICSNIGTCWIIVNGEKVFVD